jgi:hypothetical protein
VFVSSFGREWAELQSCGRILAMASSDPPPGERDVFSGLPNARPQRRSAKRDRGGGAAERPAAKKAPPQARAAASSKPSAARGKSRAKGGAKPKLAPVPPAGYATPTDDDRPHGADLVGTAVQAAGELAQIALGAGARGLRRAARRIRP